MANNPYSLIHTRPQGVNYKRYNDRGYVTPNFEYSEGIRPTGEFMPAPYLPKVRFNQYFEDYIVISGGKLVAMDSNGYIVPAGYKKELVAPSIVYTQEDADRGVLNASGTPVVAGELVATSMNLEGITVSSPVGVSSYNYWTNPGGDGTNPALYNTMNWNLQHRVAFVTDYVLQLPAVLDKAGYDAMPFAGMGAFVGVDPKPGMFTTFDADSNFSLIGYDIGATDMGEVTGQIYTVDTTFPKDYLERVRTQYEEFGELEKMPGTATEGKPHAISYSGGYALITINLINR